MEHRPDSLAGFIDHTLLKPDASITDINRLCSEAAEHRFASVCVAPVYVAHAASQLKGAGVKVATVVGFPSGTTTTLVKALEARDAVAAGADELDMVLWIGALKDGRDHDVVRDIHAVVQAAQGCLVKVILETALLDDDEKRRACHLVRKAGAHYVKTSTGFGPGGATVEDVRLMRDAVGPDMGVKASGGVRDYDTALQMIDAGASRIGTSSGVAIVASGASPIR